MKFGKFVEDELDAVLHPPIGILLDTVVVSLHVADSNGQMEFATPRFLNAWPRSTADGRPIVPSHSSRALHAEQQPVIGRTGGS